MALSRRPLRLSSRTIGRYRIGSHSAELFDRIEARGAISYDYLLEVRDQAGDVDLIVSAEVCDVGTRCVGVFSAAGHANYPVPGRMPDAASFKRYAFELLEQWLGCDVDPVVSFEALGPTRARQVSKKEMPSLVTPAASRRPDR